MAFSKAHLQLSNKAERDARKKEKASRIPSNGMAHLVTHASFAENVEQVAREKELEDATRKSRSDMTAAWKAFNVAQKAARDAWKARKDDCKAKGVAFSILAPSSYRGKYGRCSRAPF